MREALDVASRFSLWMYECNLEHVFMLLGIETPAINPVRGGTDGSRLSYMGLPCPNLCTGGHNYHGKYEFICIQSMEKTVELLLKIAEKFTKVEKQA